MPQINSLYIKNSITTPRHNSFGRFSFLCIALGAALLANNAIANSINWTNGVLETSETNHGADLNINHSSDKAAFILNRTTSSLSDSPNFKKVTIEADNKADIYIARPKDLSGPIFIDSMLNKSNKGIHLFNGSRIISFSTELPNTRSRLGLINNPLINQILVNDGTSLSLSSGLMHEILNTPSVRSIINHGNMEIVIYHGQVDKFDNYGSISRISANVGEINSHAGSIQAIVLQKWQKIVKINLTNTMLGGTTNGDIKDGITSSGVIGDGNGDAITITDSTVLGFDNRGTINGNIKIVNSKVSDYSYIDLSNSLFGFITDTGLYNTGTINGAITYSGNDELNLVNRGIISSNGSNEANLVLASGSLRVKEWYVTINGENVTKETAMIAKGKEKLSVDKIVINKIENVMPNGNPKFNLNYAVLDANNNFMPLDERNPNEAARPKEVYFAKALQDYGLGGRYEPDTGWYRAEVIVPKTANSVLGQTLVSQLARRQVFVEGAMTDVSQSELYHRMQEHQDRMWFVKPYFSSDKSKLSGGTVVKGHTTGFLTGLSVMPNNENIASFFFGYESYDGSASTLNLDMDTLYAGAKYMRLFGHAESHDYFAKADLMGGYTSSDIKRNIAGSNANGTARTLSYNAAVHAGMNYYLMHMSTLTPEIGVGVFGGRTRAFDIAGTNAQAITERYDAAHMNVAYGDASLKWLQNWHPVLGTPLVKTLVAGGIRYNFNHSVDVGADIGGIRGTGSVDLPSTYQYLNTSLILDFGKNVSVTLGYVGVYDSTGHSHNASAKFEYTF
ncbi:autotransporter outer membrane beta-barrel domain-containing protein [Sutterella wadsworthensis]|uniref:autotransporter outer membrane beta-barrel domain-containing protein n=3 Tax=Bacteria TaxID=2 RepID=UPI0013F59F4D|nr:autotransporter outer membrane beta-barrel domain-containing protein [Sutterella wadsworthensis]